MEEGCMVGRKNLGLNPATEWAGGETPVDLHVVGQAALALEHLESQQPHKTPKK